MRLCEPVTYDAVNRTLHIAIHLSVPPPLPQVQTLQAAARPLIPLSRAIRECLESKGQQGLRDASLKTIAQALGAFERAQGERMCGEICAGDVESYLSSRDWRPATRRNYRCSLQTFFAWCLARDYVSKNPVSAVPVPMLENKAPGILTVPQSRDLLTACRRTDLGMLAFFVLALFCGVRPQEILRLSPDNVVVDKRYVEIPAAKAKCRQRRLVSLPENAIAWLGLSPVELPPRNWRKRFDHVRVVAGLLKEWSHDCMRHSFASYHLALHGSADKTATQLGHRSTAMLFAHYRELTCAESAAAFFGLLPDTA